MAEQKRWKKRPENSTWGDYGADDQLGRMNELTPAKVKQGIAEVKEGKTFCLSMPLDYPGGNVLNPRRFPPQIRPSLRGDKPNWHYRTEWDKPGMTDVINDDVVIMHLQYSTQWDTLAHVGALFDANGTGKPEPTFYNGYRGGIDLVGPSEGKEAGAVPGTFVEAKGTSSANALGAENMAVKCLQGRGVMIDLHAHYGRKRHAVGYDDLMRVMAADGIEVEAGDFVLLRTGFDELILEGNKKPDRHLLETSCSGLDGGDPRLQQWVSETKLVALISDNYAVELMPTSFAPGQCAMLPLHQHCLFKTGVNLGEIWRLSELADWLRANNRSRFLLTAPPLRLPGAVGSPATPVATV
jgi:kynurenine formamidase